MSQQDDSSRAWWAPRDLALEECLACELGQLRLWLRRTRGEWLLAHEHGPDPLASEISLALQAPALVIPDSMAAQRFGFRDSPAQLQLQPCHADRSLMINPEMPFSLTPGESTTVYVSLPLWLRVQVGTAGTSLLELPLQLLSDTWFGPVAGEGVLCYASRSQARLTLDDDPGPPRVIAVVRVVNEAEGHLPLAGMRLPLPQLSLYACADGRFWCEPITLSRENDDEHARLELGKRPPAEAGRATLLSGPRTQPGKGDLFRAFGELLRRGGEKIGSRLASARGRGMVDA